MAGHPIFAALYDRMLAGTERAGSPTCAPRCSRGPPGGRSSSAPAPGANAAHYPAAVTEVVLTEPDPHMARRLRDKLAGEPAAVRLRGRRDRGREPAVRRRLLRHRHLDPGPLHGRRSRRAPRPRSPACCARAAGCCCSSMFAIPATGGSAAGRTGSSGPGAGWRAAAIRTATPPRRSQPPGFDVSGLEPAELPKAPPLVAADDPGVRRVRSPGR